MPLSFEKMHGLGNDFVIIDNRAGDHDLTEAQVQIICDRRIGVGCDQLVMLEPPTQSGADVFMRIFNPDGSEAGACGNATRCVASRMMKAAQLNSVGVETVTGVLIAGLLGDGRVRVDMGPPRLEWDRIPLAREADTSALEIREGPLKYPAAVSMGNPHAVFFVDDVNDIELEKLGPVLEHHQMFPHRANIEIAEIISPTAIRMRVWERGVGITHACGSGACATLVAAARRELTERKAEVILDGGVLEIDWDVNDHVWMTGPVARVYRGILDEAVLDL